MVAIRKATVEDANLLAEIGSASFISSHGSSAAPEVIQSYVDEKYTPEVFKNELDEQKNRYSLIYHQQQPAGYSKIIFNASGKNIIFENAAKLERLYLLKEFYNLKLGYELLNYNIELSKKNHQSCIWLFVWKENHRAVRFYEKTGFKIIGDYDFKLTENHANPNYQLMLTL